MNVQLIAKALLVCALLCLPQSALAVEIGQKLVPFKGNYLNGSSFDLRKSIGLKPVILVFWATWCPSCRSEVPKINELVKQFGDRVDLVAVNIGANDSPRRAELFASKLDVQYPIFFDATGEVSRRYHLLGVPTIIVADRDGVIQFRNFMTPRISEASFADLMEN